MSYKPNIQNSVMGEGRLAPKFKKRNFKNLTTGATKNFDFYLFLFQFKKSNNKKLC